MVPDLSPADAPAPLAATRSTDVTVTSEPSVIFRSPEDDQLINLWLHGRSVHTQEAYRRDVDLFRIFRPRPLAAITLGDIQAFDDSMEDLAASSRKRRLSAIKSLLTFAQKTGYLQYNVGAAVILPKSKNTIGERILAEEEVQRMIEMETDPRDHMLLIMLYATGARVSEICRLTWRDCQTQKKGGQVTLFGKGEKTRHVLLKAETFLELLSMRDSAGADDPVFRSEKGGALSRQQVYRIVRAAADRAGIEADVSPHWLRHAHVSHALDRGAPVHLVQATVGHSSLDTTSHYAHARPTDSSARYLNV